MMEFYLFCCLESLSDLCQAILGETVDQVEDCLATALVVVLFIIKQEEQDRLSSRTHLQIKGYLF